MTSVGVKAFFKSMLVKGRHRDYPINISLVFALPANKYVLFDRDSPNETVLFLMQFGVSALKAVYKSN
jgi:hypothetical protein